MFPGACKHVYTCYNMNRGKRCRYADHEAKRSDRLLEKDGWEYVPSNGGSHQKYKKGTQTITIPYHNKDLPTGLFMKIMKVTGLKK